MCTTRRIKQILITTSIFRNTFYYQKFDC